MKTTDRNALIAFPILILIGFLVALAGSQGGDFGCWSSIICLVSRAGLSNPVAGLYPGLFVTD